MKFSRKLQRQVEIKIRHAMATGMLPSIVRSPSTGEHARQELDKSDGNGLSHSK